MKAIRQAQTRMILDAHNREDISYSRMNEMFNELADEFAIGFAEWVDSDFYQGDDVNEYHKSIIEYREGKIFTIKELLEIYKKEKGL
jgi:hypothetical protein